jgi:diguanylate cyclase (GGDEF)-like protein
LQTTDEQTASLVVPFAIRDEAQGFVAVRSNRLRKFSDDDIELIQILANQAAAAVENAALYRRIEHLAITDGLTGLYNHRYFYKRLHQECARADRYSEPLSLLMLDIDDFKRFNDKFGHPLGDQALHDVAGILQSGLRRGIDIAARYGGEEFSVILPNTPIGGASVVSGRLQQQITELGAELTPDEDDASAIHVGERIRTEVAGTLLLGHGRRRYAHLTVSIGAAEFGAASCKQLDELVNRADKALYVAKRNGKNRVEVYND